MPFGLGRSCWECCQWKVARVWVDLRGMLLALLGVCLVDEAAGRGCVGLAVWLCTCMAVECSGLFVVRLLGVGALLLLSVLDAAVFV
jgi:hypothetical protein